MKISTKKIKMEQALIAKAIMSWDRFDTGKAAIKALDELAADGTEEESIRRRGNIAGCPRDNE